MGRFTVKARERVKKARLYISGLGLFTAGVNGKPLSENLFEPGESEFNRRVYYVTYDILPFLQEGENAVGVVLGNGQYVNFAVDPVMKKGMEPCRKSIVTRRMTRFFSRTASAGTRSCLPRWS